jgi:predicted lysophospholipase L1 biosynthesis ABC-type transport system permease subunit
MASAPSPRRDRGPSARPAHVATPAGTSDWPAEAADAIERVVGAVRDKTTGPAITVARWVVYGTFALVVGTVVAVMIAIAAVRALDSYLPDAWVGEQHTWAAHLIIGLLFTIVGMVLWSRRAAPADAR